MTTQAAKLLDDALKLGESERADMAACLFASLGDPAYRQVESAWEAEIERRLHAIDSNQATFVPWEEARQRMFSNG